MQISLVVQETTHCNQDNKNYLLDIDPTCQIDV